MKTTISKKIDTFKVAVAGNPNSGKSTLINGIAGTKMQVGNWPGVTVEKKEADIVFKNIQIKLVDLPGAYSLSPYTQEEIIARDYLLKDKPDLIVNVVDSTNLERNLYLTIQLLELEIPIILALNIYDESESKGYKINTQTIEEILGVKVIPTIATQKVGLENLMDEIIAYSEKKEKQFPNTLKYNNDLEESISSVITIIKDEFNFDENNIKKRWLTLKIIEGDELVLDEFQITNRDEMVSMTCSHLLEAHDEDLESLMADQRYGLASGLTQKVVSKPNKDKKELTEKIDDIVLNKFFGIPIFLAAMWIMFKFTFDLANPFVDWIDGVTAGPLTNWITAGLNSVNTSEWIISLLTEGIVAGVGFVLVFVPVIFAMMFFVTFLEGSGYMARAAFVMDRVMNSIGLHGKSFIPLLLGFGCNVPSIYATRTLENKRDKILTSLLVPFMSCGARLPVYVIFIAVFFKDNAGTVLWGLYTLGLLVAVLTGLILKKTIFKGESPMFIMELPPYRLPALRSLMIHTWEKGKHFLIKAGTYILAVSVFVWSLLNLPWGVEHKKDSYLGLAGQTAATVLAPLGFGNWEAASSLITGIIAKEIVVGTMAEIYVNEIVKDEVTEIDILADLGEIGGGFISASYDAAVNVISTFGIATISAEEEEEQDLLKSVIQNKFTPLSAFSFMVFVLLYMPCIITGVAYKQEFGSWKWYWVSLFNGFIVAWIFSLIIYQIGSSIGLGA